MEHVISLLKGLTNFLDEYYKKYKKDALAEYNELIYAIVCLEEIVRLSKRVSENTIKTDEKLNEVIDAVLYNFKNDIYDDLEEVADDLELVRETMKKVYVKEKVLKLLDEVRVVLDWNDKSLTEQLEALVRLINDIFDLK